MSYAISLATFCYTAGFVGDFLVPKSMDSSPTHTIRPARREAAMSAHAMNAYREDLAYIHDAGYGALAKAAAQRILQELQTHGFRDGTVIDLGCGSGIFARIVSDAGYKVIGFDLSENMVAIARQRAGLTGFLAQKPALEPPTAP